MRGRGVIRYQLIVIRGKAGKALSRKHPPSLKLWRGKRKEKENTGKEGRINAGMLGSWEAGKLRGTLLR
jgi:hypothetical protein